MLSTVLGLPKGERVTDHYSHLAPEAVVFPKGCCHHEFNESPEQMAKISFISLSYIHGTETNIFGNRKFLIIYVRSSLHGKKEFLQERQI